MGPPGGCTGAAQCTSRYNPLPSVGWPSHHPLRGYGSGWAGEPAYAGGGGDALGSSSLSSTLESKGMRAKPLTLKQANTLVELLHRHHKPVVGHRFSIGAEADGELVGAVIIGRPVARAVDQYSVAEVTRLVTNGHRNACSFLYGRAARVAQTMGFDRIQTYILESEPGTSLLAAGWHCEGKLRPNGRGWNNRANRRTDQPVEPKVRWCREFKH